jgi:hypothetical protein
MYTLANAVAATGSGLAKAGTWVSTGYENISHALGRGYGRPHRFTVTITYTGSPTGVQASLQGSIDGTNWTDLDSSTNTSGEVLFISNKPVNFIRGKLTTLTGGSSPTMTMTVEIG